MRDVQCMMELLAVEQVFKFFQWLLANETSFLSATSSSCDQFYQIPSMVAYKNFDCTLCNISNTSDSVSSDIQTPRRELKIRRVAEYF